MKSIIEETGVEAIDTQDDGIVRLDKNINFDFFVWLYHSCNFKFSMAFAGENHCKGFDKPGEV